MKETIWLRTEILSLVSEPVLNRCKVSYNSLRLNSRRFRNDFLPVNNFLQINPHFKTKINWIFVKNVLNLVRWTVKEVSKLILSNLYACWKRVALNVCSFWFLCLMPLVFDFSMNSLVLNVDDYNVALSRLDEFH